MKRWASGVTRIFFIAAFLAFVSSGPTFSGAVHQQLAAASDSGCTQTTGSSGAVTSNCQHVDRTVEQGQQNPQVVNQGECTNDNIKQWAASSDKSLQKKAQACQARTGKLTFKDENGNTVEIPMTNSDGTVNTKGLADAATAQQQGKQVTYSPAGSDQKLPLGQLPAGIQNLDGTQQLQSVLSNAYNQEGPVTAAQEGARAQVLQGLASLASGDTGGSNPAAPAPTLGTLPVGFQGGTVQSLTGEVNPTFDKTVPGFSSQGTPSGVAGTTFGTTPEGIPAPTWDENAPLGGVSSLEAGTPAITNDAFLLSKAAETGSAYPIQVVDPSGNVVATLRGEDYGLKGLGLLTVDAKALNKNSFQFGMGTQAERIENTLLTGPQGDVFAHTNASGHSLAQDIGTTLDANEAQKNFFARLWDAAGGPDRLAVQGSTIQDGTVSLIYPQEQAITGMSADQYAALHAAPPHPDSGLPGSSTGVPYGSDITKPVQGPAGTESGPTGHPAPVLGSNQNLISDIVRPGDSGAQSGKSPLAPIINQANPLIAELQQKGMPHTQSGVGSIMNQDNPLFAAWKLQGLPDTQSGPLHPPSPSSLAVVAQSAAETPAETPPLKVTIVSEADLKKMFPSAPGAPSADESVGRSFTLEAEFSPAPSPLGPTVDHPNVPPAGEPYTVPTEQPSNPTQGTQNEPSSIATAPSGTTPPIKQAGALPSGGTTPSPRAGGAVPSGASQASPIQPIIDALKTLASYIPQPTLSPQQQQTRQQQPSPQQQQGVAVPQGKPLPAPSQDNPTVITSTVPSADTVAPPSQKQSAIDAIAFIVDSPLQQQAAPTDKCAGLADPFICKYGPPMGLGAPKEDISPAQKIDRALQQLQNAGKLAEQASKAMSPKQGTQAATMAKDAVETLAKAVGDVAGGQGVSPQDKQQLQNAAAQAQATAKQILQKVQNWDYNGVEDLSKKLGQQVTNVAANAKKVAAAATAPPSVPTKTVETSQTQTPPASPGKAPPAANPPPAQPAPQSPPSQTQPLRETRTASCPGNNCSGIKASGVALDQIRQILQKFGGTVGAQTPKAETYASFSSPSQWLAADVVKRIAYCAQNGWCTIGQQDAQWATPDRDHPTLNRNSRSYAVAAGYLGKNVGSLTPDDVRHVLETRIDPKDITGIMRVSIGVVCAEYSLCSGQFLSAADKTEAYKILAASGVGTGAPTSPDVAPAQSTAARAMAPAGTPGKDAHPQEEGSRTPAEKFSPGSKDPQDALKNAAERQDFVFAKDGKLLTPEEAGKLSSEERANLDVYEPEPTYANERIKSIYGTVADMKGTDVIKAGDMTYHAAGKAGAYLARQTQAAQDAVENAARDAQLNADPRTAALHGDSYLRTVGGGTTRKVYYMSKDGFLGDQVGKVEVLSETDAKLRAAAQMRGVQTQERADGLYTADGKRLELRNEGTKVVQAPPKQMLPNSAYGRLGRVAQAAGVPTQRLTHDQWIQEMKNKGIRVVDLSSQARGVAAARGVIAAVAMTIHGDVAKGANLVRYEMGQLAAGNAAAQAVLTEDGTMYVLQRLDTYAAHAASMNSKGFGFETAGADGGREATDAQFDVQKKMVDIAMSHGMQVATHGQAEPGHRDTREGGQRIVDYVYGNSFIESPQVGLYAVDQSNGAAQRVGDIIDSSALAGAQAHVDFTSTDANGNPDGKISIGLQDIGDVGHVTASLATDPNGNKLGIQYDYTPPPPPPPPPAPDTRGPIQRIVDGFRQTMQNLFGKPQQQGGGGSGSSSGGGSSAAQQIAPAQQPGSTPNSTVQLSCLPQTVVNKSTVAIAWTCPTGTVAQFDGFIATSSITGSVSVRVATTSSSVSYGLRCVGKTSTQPLSCAVQVLHPQVTLVAKPEQAQPKDQVDLKWSAADVTACRLYAPPGILLMSGGTTGQATTLPLAHSAIFRIMCDTSAFTSVFGSVTVKVAGDTQPPLDTTLPQPSAAATQSSAPVSPADQVPVSSQIGPSNPNQPDASGATAACDPESPGYIDCLTNLMQSQDRLF